MKGKDDLLKHFLEPFCEDISECNKTSQQICLDQIRWKIEVGCFSSVEVSHVSFLEKTCLT